MQSTNEALDKDQPLKENLSQIFRLHNNIVSRTQDIYTKKLAQLIMLNINVVRDL